MTPQGMLLIAVALSLLLSKTWWKSAELWGAQEEALCG